MCDRRNCRRPCAPYEQCDPNCSPLECTPGCYTGAQLDGMPQCAPRCSQPCSSSITVQQPPRLINKKRVVFTEKIVPEPMVVNRCRQVTIPKVVDTTRVIKVPKLVWVDQMVREPRVIYYPSMVPDPYVVCYPKRVCEPREVCQSVLCQPKPQKIDIPPPQEYCCYPNGPLNYQPSTSCPPCPTGPSAPCGSLPGFSTNQYPMCGPCGPSAPYSPNNCAPYGCGQYGMPNRSWGSPCAPCAPCMPSCPGSWNPYC